MAHLFSPKILPTFFVFWHYITLNGRTDKAGDAKSRGFGAVLRHLYE